MFFMEIAHPNWFERGLITVAQGIFFNFYFFMYLFWPRLAHRMIYYFEEEAVKSYTQYLEMIQNGEVEDVPAPEIAIEYYNLLPDAKLSDMIRYVRRDEAKHAQVNWDYSFR